MVDELFDRLRLLEQDHEPDGWPAVQMWCITALLNEADAARSQIADLCAANHALEAEVEALRKENADLANEIREHNEGCESACKARRDAGPSHCPFPAYGRDCPDCPRDGMIGMYSITRAAAAMAPADVAPGAGGGGNG